MTQTHRSSLALRRAVPGAALAALTGLAYTNRARLKNVAALLLSRQRYNAAAQHGLQVRFTHVPPGWVPLTLHADLGPTLSEVIGRPVEATAFSRIGGFRGRHPYSEFLNPASPFYQVWVGAYVVFDGPPPNDHRPSTIDHEQGSAVYGPSSMVQFGFDPSGQLVLQDALDVLEADQRLVYHGAGCDRTFPDGRRTKADMESLVVRSVTEDGIAWNVLTGQADTWSTFRHGVSPEARWYNPWFYGIVPPDVQPAHPDWPPIRYHGQFWMRHVPEWGATCAKFYLYPETKDPSGVTLRWGEVLLDDLQAMLRGIEFRK